MAVIRKAGKRGRKDAVPLTGVGTLDDYATAPLPALPPKVTVPNVADWQMDGNDQWGDCVMAGTGHVDAAVAAILTALDLASDAPAVPADTAVVDEYKTLTGAEQPGDANDTGLVITTVLKQWQQAGLFGSKLAAYAPVSLAANHHLRQAIALCGAVILGVNLPDSAEQQFETGANWSWTGDQPTGGHEMVAVGYDGVWIQCVTWGAVVNVGPRWLSHYAEEAYAPLHEAYVNAGRGPTIDIAALQHDLPVLR